VYRFDTGRQAENKPDTWINEYRQREREGENERHMDGQIDKL